MRMVSFLLFALSSVSVFSEEILFNNDFESGSSAWYSFRYYGTITFKDDAGVAGTDIEAFFTFNYASPNDYEDQIIQPGVTVHPGYRYTLSLGAVGLENTTRSIWFGIQHNGGSSTYLGDGSDIWTKYLEIPASLSYQTYKEFSASWDNCSVNDSYVQAYLNGGTSAVDFKVAWVSVDEAPITCEASSSSSVVSSSSATSSSSITVSSSSSLATSDALVRINSIGFPTEATKIAVFKQGNASSVFLRNTSTSADILTITPSATSTWNPSGETVRSVDFSSVTAPGSYALYQGSSKISNNFTIGDDSYDALVNGLLKFYYYQRASTALSSTYAGSWSRSSGHPDNTVYIHSSAGSGTISSPKGWYDAGDYGKYIVNSGITTYTLLSLYEHFPDFWGSRTWNIPESSNSTPDLLDEIRWNLDWMRTMQASDGGVYHKLTTLQFSDAVMPSSDVATRYVFMKTTTASLDFAAVMAAASRIYADIDPTFAAGCLADAEDAYDWADAHPTAYYVQPSGVNTGEYGDSDASDEKIWASMELYLATKNSAYLTPVQSRGFQAQVPDWGDVDGLALYTVTAHASEFPTALANAAKDSLLSAADKLRTAAETSGYRVPMQSADFVWGSNAVAANQGDLLMHAWYATGDPGYHSAAQQALDYLLGRNALNRSLVTGFGTNAPKSPHHRPSQADGITNPVPGMLVGGPQPGGEDVGYETWECSNYVVSGKPALSYLDNDCSYASNEVAINWNASIAYLAGSLSAVAQGATIAIEHQEEVPVHVVSPVMAAAHKTRLIVEGNAILLRKTSGERYNLKGHRIR